MPEFEVTVEATRSMTCSIKITFTADDEDAAYDEALDQANSGELFEQMEDHWESSHTDFDIAKVTQNDQDDE